MLFDRGEIPPLGVSLRGYQNEAINGVFDWFDQKTGNPLIILPTGSGKSVVIAGFLHAAATVDRGFRAVVATHVKELVAQNYAAMMDAWPGAPAGICSAGLDRREHDAPIVFAGVQSCWRKPEKLGRRDLVLIDEAHLIGAEADGMYRNMLTGLLELNPKLKVVGLTATPFRTGEGMLYGEKALFDGVAYEAPLAQMIKDGWLSPVITRGTQSSIDVAGLSKRGGDFAEGELERAATTGDVVERAARELVARAANRKSWLLFCCGVSHAEQVASALKKIGIECATLFGSTKTEDRDRIVREFRAGKIRALANVNVLTTGFDAPGVDLIAMLRPTCSPVLYVQMVGRGLRKAPGKSDCLVLDFGGNMVRHGPIDEVHVKKPGEHDGGVFARECPKCMRLVSVSTPTCPSCGYVWPIVTGDATPDHDAKPDERSMLVSGLHPTGGIERWRVDRVDYRMHQKGGKPTTMCVEYICGISRRAREWVCLEHAPGSFPRKKAEKWWRDRTATKGNIPTPETVDLALCLAEAGCLAKPSTITVDVRGEWPEIKGVRFDDVEEVPF